MGGHPGCMCLFDALSQKTQPQGRLILAGVGCTLLSRDCHTLDFPSDLGCLILSLFIQTTVSPAQCIARVYQFRPLTKHLSFPRPSVPGPPTLSSWFSPVLHCVRSNRAFTVSVGSGVSQTWLSLSSASYKQVTQFPLPQSSHL